RHRVRIVVENATLGPGSPTRPSASVGRAVAADLEFPRFADGRGPACPIGRRNKAVSSMLCMGLAKVGRLPMTTHKVGYFIGSLARESINRKLAKALVRLAPPELAMSEIPFRDLPLYS